MNENSENSNKKNGGFLANKPWLIPVCVVVLVLVIAVVVFMMTRPAAPDVEPSESSTMQTEPTEEDTVPEEDQTMEMLPNMAELYAQNPDIAGYIRIDGTKLDYPVMYTPDDEQKYNHMAFDGTYSYAGTPFISQDCAIDPESDNLVIYGHNMRNGTGFKTVILYADEDFYKEHPTIYYSTLYEEREYEIVAAFYDRVYYNYEEVFKYYKFIDYENEMQFNEAVEYYKANSVYDTGVEVEYGDKLITLVTCSYHEKYGRFVVVAKFPGEETPADVE